MIKRKTPEADLEKSSWMRNLLGGMAVLSIMIGIFAFTSYNLSETGGAEYMEDFLEDEIIPTLQATPPPPPPPPPATTVIEIVDDEEEIEEELVIEDLDLDEDTEIEEIEFEEEVFDDTPFMVVENMPALGPCKEMRGDERHQCTQLEIIRFVTKNTKYPPIAKDAGIQGTVFVYFIVDRNGDIKDAKVLRPVDSRLDKEALRVVKNLPKFEPGEQRGKPVNVQYTIPVKFVIR